MSIKKVASKAEYLSRRFRLGLQFNSKCFLSDKNAVPDKRKTYQKISMELKNLTHKCPLFVAKKIPSVFIQSYWKISSHKIKIVHNMHGILGHTYKQGHQFVLDHCRHWGKQTCCRWWSLHIVLLSMIAGLKSQVTRLLHMEIRSSRFPVSKSCELGISIEEGQF